MKKIEYILVIVSILALLIFVGIIYSNYQKTPEDYSSITKYNDSILFNKIDSVKQEIQIIKKRKPKCNTKLPQKDTLKK